MSIEQQLEERLGMMPQNSTSAPDVIIPGVDGNDNNNINSDIYDVQEDYSLPTPASTLANAIVCPLFNGASYAQGMATMVGLYGCYHLGI